QVNLAENIYYLGFNDRRTHLFENLWPIPYGVSYNSYLIVDEKIALMDTVEHSFAEEYLDQIEVLTNGRPVDYLIINHMEPDHSGSLKAVVAKYPNITLVGNKKTFDMVENYYKVKENTLEVYDDYELPLGKNLLRFATIPMVHWPETMVTYEMTNKILFSGDAFGSFGTLDGGVFDDELNLAVYEEEMMRYFTNIVGKYCPHTQRALKKVESFDIKMIAATHGPVWRTDLEFILSRYQKWSTYTTDPGAVIVYGSMYGNTAKMADVIARQLAVRGIKNIRVYDASKTHASYIISDIFKYKAFIVGSAAYNNELFPSVENLLTKIEHYGIKNHLLGIFGSFGWSGGGVKNLQKFAENIKWELVGQPVEEKGTLKEDKFEHCIQLANAIADRLLV
ncbi:MAG TPA: FprA family A-type flavoprotein, partial [Prolixibacteraceae bacterium]|nr:FprA family A-type flavoprotein [Prolixibacteraceae bacterium]